MEMDKLLQEQKEIKNKLKIIQKQISVHPLQIDKGRKVFSIIFSILDKSDIQYFLDNMTGYDDKKDLIKNGNKINEIVGHFRPPEYFLHTFFFNNLKLSFNIIVEDGHESVKTDITLKDNNNIIINLYDDYYQNLDDIRECIEKTSKNISDSNKPFILLLKKFFETEYSIDEIYGNLS